MLIKHRLKSGRKFSIYNILLYLLSHTEWDNELQNLVYGIKFNLLR